MFLFNVLLILGVDLYNFLCYCEKMLIFEFLIMGYFKIVFNNLVCLVEWVFFIKLLSCIIDIFVMLCMLICDVLFGCDY